MNTNNEKVNGNIDSGKNKSSEQLYLEYKNFIFSLCCRYFPDRTEAEDVCHDVFIKIFKNLDSFREESKLSTWIYRLTVNQCLNHIRKKKILKWFSLDFMTEEGNSITEIPDQSENPESEYEKKDADKILNDALAKLPERQKTALLLHNYEDLSYQEIANIMNCSVSSVESLIFRSKQTLVKQLLKKKMKKDASI
jgi:RNA polymerase sigma-70 factor (ECF subfamily)